MTDSYQIEGEIWIDDNNKIDNVTTYVRIEDTSRADAPSRMIAQNILRNVKFRSEGDKKVLQFHISTPLSKDDKTYTINVHVDINGNGKIDQGDYINMESYPVPLQGSRQKIVVKVKQIR